MLVLRAIYGRIEPALQWYKLYSEILTEKGFELIQHGRCVANRLVNGKQFTFVWYVDDRKLSHMEAKVVEYLINDMKNQFGELVNKGNKHTFLSMHINIT